jgi:hypothetical protein
MHTIHTLHITCKIQFAHYVFCVYGIPLMRRRNISWGGEVDALAVALAHERHMDVSELLTALVIEESMNPRIKPKQPTPGYLKSLTKAILETQDYAKQNLARLNEEPVPYPKNKTTPQKPKK